MRRLSVGLLCSAAVHAALLLAVIATVGIQASQPLFVDLVHDFGRPVGVASAEVAPAGGAAAGGEPRPARREPHDTQAIAARRAPPPAPAGASVASADHQRPPTPEPIELGPPPEPIQTIPEPPVVTSAREPATGSVASAPVAVPAPVASTGGGDGTQVAREPVGSGNGEARDTGVGTGGAGASRPGSGSVALAVPGGSDDGEYTGYLGLVRGRIQQLLVYPTAARRRGLTGTVLIELAIETTGAISDVRLAASSSHRLLDDAALDAVRGLERVPFPSGLRPRRLRARLPVVFDLR